MNSWLRGKRWYEDVTLKTPPCVWYVGIYPIHLHRCLHRHRHTDIWVWYMATWEQSLRLSTPQNETQEGNNITWVESVSHLGTVFVLCLWRNNVDQIISAKRITNFYYSSIFNCLTDRDQPKLRSGQGLKRVKPNALQHLRSWSWRWMDKGDGRLCISQTQYGQ